MDAEERLKTLIHRWEADLIARMQGASETGRAEIERWTTEYIAALQVEMPLSVKQVLDRGGAVRAIDVECPSGRLNQLSIDNHTGSRYDLYFPEVSVEPQPRSPVGKVRLTIIVEPIKP